MLPSAERVHQPRDWMFPWTIPDQADTEADAGADTAGGKDRRSRVRPATEEPIAYRAWCIEHDAELTVD